jgi:putative transposase
MSDPFPDDVDEQSWDEACRRADAIRNFLKRRTGSTKTGDVVELAAEIGLSQATAYRLIKVFRAGGTILSLVDRKSGRPEGHRVLDEKREKVIQATIKAFYLKRNRPTVSPLVREVQTNCILAGLKPPHRRRGRHRRAHRT